MPDVRGTIEYLQNLELYATEKPYWCFLPPREDFDPDEQRVDNLEFEDHDVAITDIRGLKGDVNLERYGFQVLSHDTGVSNFTSADAVEAYKRETERLLTEALAATHVKCYDLRLRKNIIFQRTEFDLNNPLHTEGPARGAHNDITIESGPRVIDRYLSQPEKEAFLRAGYRVRIVNTWRSLLPVIEDQPLALCDSHSVGAADLMPADRLVPDRVGEVYYLKYNPKHQWYWLSTQKSSEPYVFVMYDTKAGTHARFANNFWGRDDAGVSPLLDRMQNAKTTCDELKAFYNSRAALEDEYARKLSALCRKPLGSGETGTLRASFDVLRGEVESMSKQHALIASQMKSELEEPLGAFAGGMKERRKIIQAGIERLLKTKQTQTAHVNKSRDKYEQDCLRIKGYLAQGHMVMGQEERKNKAKLEKTQINMASNSNEYEAAIKVLEETIGRWNKEWKAACDKFQDLEEERIDFMKASLWSFANIASTVCVSDDASCEKVRLALENCEVEKDIIGFIKSAGTGQEIPDPPKYINFARGDMADTASEASEDDAYSVAQFQRTMKPEYRSSSPNPSTYESHHEPQSELSQRINQAQPSVEDEDETLSRTNSGRPPPLNYKQPEPNVPPNYSPSQHGELAQVPHNQYPTDGMTMFCRAAPSSVNGSALSSNTRPSSRDSGSEYSNPTSYTSADPMSGKNSPIKGPPVNGVQMPGMASSPDKSVQKKRSGFFSNSPFRRKSKRENDHQAHTPNPNRNTWNPASSSRINLTPNNMSSTPQQSNSSRTSPTRQGLFNRGSAPEGEEPADPRASFQLNVGNNVFDVASPDSQSTPKASFRKGLPAASVTDDLSMDPIAQALADLKSGVGASSMNKQASMRVQADRYHGVATPAPDAQPLGRPGMISAASQDRLASQRGTPPPAYDGGRGGGAPALGVPQPAFTSKEMRSRTENWGTGSAYGGSNAGGRGSQQQSRATTNGGTRSRSPGPGMSMPRAASPQPMRARSPAPGVDMRARSPGPGGPGHAGLVGAQFSAMRAKSPVPPQDPSQGQAQHRAASPNPYARAPVPRGQMQQRQNSGGMEMQLSSSDVQRYGGGREQYGSGRSRQGMMGDGGGRPMSAYGGEPYMNGGGAGGQRGGMDMQMRRERSKSMAAPLQQKTMLHYARALYSYTAAIPEELSFSKGDILAVLRLQDDGWWEAEISKGRQNIGAVGLVPSNYLQRC